MTALPSANRPPSVEELSEQERELMRKLDEIRAAKAAAKKAEEELLANEELVLTVVKLENREVWAKTQRKRDDVVNVFRSAPGRRFDYNTDSNVIPVDFWKPTLDKLAALPNLKIVYTNGVKEEIASFDAIPAYEVAMSPDDKWLYVLVRNADSYPLTRIPGNRYESSTKKHEARWLIPINEGYRLYESLKNLEKVLWHERAQDIVLRDMEKRAKLDEIALKTESPEIRARVKFVGDELILRHFQEVGVEFIEACGGRVILADQMGLGKTWQIIAFALMKGLRLCVVCPASLKANWSREIHRLTGETAYIMQGSEPSRHDVRRLLVDKPKFAIINYDILSRKTETYNEEAFKKTGLKSELQIHYVWAEVINLAGFDVIACDEAHFAKNMDAARTQAVLTLKSPYFIGATGTPVMNRPGELFPILNVIAPEKFPDFSAFCSAYTYNNRSAKNVEELRALLKPIMIRRMKKDVEKELPPINRIYHWVELSAKARRICDKIMKGIYEVLSEWSPGEAGSEKRVTNLLVQIMRLKQTVAIDKIDTVADLGRDAVDSMSDNDAIGAKKCIIFSQFKPVVRAIAKRLGHEAVWINGDLSQRERTKVIDQFKQDHVIKFLVATSAVASEGLNLQEAGAVIFTDLLWTPAGHEQCEGRAYGRLADLHSIDSYYVVAEDSIDQMIQEILNRKLAVINSVVEGMDAERNSSMVMELLQKMKEEMRKK